MNKICTSIEQSKKLAEILPLESADMRYDEYISYIDGTPKVGYKKGVTDGIPCWSLASLLDALPLIDIENIEKEIYADDTYQYRVKAYIDDGYVGDWFDNPIDACYDMIITLHEQKLL